jgi:hypothetical protein
MPRDFGAQRELSVWRKQVDRLIDTGRPNPEGIRELWRCCATEQHICAFELGEIDVLRYYRSLRKWQLNYLFVIARKQLDWADVIRSSPSDLEIPVVQK